jgi:hypothetical protein
MTASVSTPPHEGSDYFMRRALHFARREMEAHPGELPISVTQMSMYLLFRGGVSAAEIAAMIEVHQGHVSRRLMAAMSALGTANTERRARVEALCVEMGQINFEVREGEVLKFPGPSRLAKPRQVVEVA